MEPLQKRLEGVHAMPAERVAEGGLLAGAFAPVLVMPRLLKNLRIR